MKKGTNASNQPPHGKRPQPVQHNNGWGLGADETTTLFVSDVFMKDMMARINGSLTTAVVGTAFMLGLIILIPVMWDHLSDDIQSQEDVLWACTGKSSDADKDKDIPVAKAKDDPQDFKTRFDTVQRDPDSLWSKSGSYFLVRSTSRYAMHVHVTIRFKAYTDFVYVRLLGEYFGNGASTNSTENVENFYTLTVTPLRSTLANATELLEEVRNTDLYFFSTVKGSTKLFVSVTQKTNSTAELDGVRDCGSNFFSIVEYTT
jgi:hypothetical protein